MKSFLLMGLFLLPLLSFANEVLENDNPSTPVNTGVTVYKEGDKTIEEYRVKGVLYSVKVIPKRGKPYYLVNANGDNDVLKANQPRARIPSWTVFSW